MLEAYVGIVNGLGDGQKASLLEHPNLRPCGLAVMFHLLGRVAADWAKGLVEPSVLKASVGLLHDLLRVLPLQSLVHDGAESVVENVLVARGINVGEFPGTMFLSCCEEREAQLV